LAENLSLIENINVLALCENVEEAHRAIKKYSPELLFLDVEMPGETGFDLLQRFKEPAFDIIFTTAYDKYALNAIKASALDYLIKPVSSKDLENVIRKHQKKKSGDLGKQIATLMQHYSGDIQKRKSLALPSLSGLELVNIDEIIRLQSEGSYTFFFLKDLKKITVSKGMKQYEELLCENGFMRIHHSHIVNLNQIRKYVKGEGGYLVMSDGSEALVSRLLKDELLKKLRTL